MNSASPEQHVVVLAPATSANLGSAFDTAGLALDWWNTLRVSVIDGDPGSVTLEVSGEGAESIAPARDNLLLEAMTRFSKEAGIALPALSLELEIGFPLGRGFGSSSAGIALGLIAAREITEADISDSDLFELASQIEGHPDNVAACLFGGATLCWNEQGAIRCHPADVHPDLAAFALVSPAPMGTKVARAILPPTVPFADATWTAGRAALLPLALAGAFDLLKPATNDVLHQRRRLAAWPDATRALDVLRARGHAAFVSGAGPSLLVLCEREQLPQVQRDAEAACEGAAGWRLQPLAISRDVGARAISSRHGDKRRVPGRIRL
jgi:homoserine kinase